jgi:hypothetical protein
LGNLETTVVALAGAFVLSIMAGSKLAGFRGLAAAGDLGLVNQIEGGALGEGHACGF